MVIIINTQKKIDIYGGNVNRNFQGKKILKKKNTMQVFTNNNAIFYC